MISQTAAGAASDGSRVAVPDAGAPAFEAEPRLPFGCCFVEGEPIALPYAVAFSGDTARAVVFTGTLTDDRDLKLGPFTQTASLRSGERFAIDPGRAAHTALGPGLYTVAGTLSAAGLAQAVRVQFGVFNRELAAIPNREIPRWMGMGAREIHLLDRWSVEDVYSFLARVGVRTIRRNMNFGLYYLGDGEFQWDLLDPVAEQARRFDLDVLALLFLWNDRHATDEFLEATGLDRADLKRLRTPLYLPEGRQFWADHYAVPLMKRYGDTIKYWQIWNEPNAGWNEDPALTKGNARQFGTPRNYYDLFVRAWKAGKALDPSLRILPALSSGHHGRDIPLLLGYGLGEYLDDGFTIHCYGGNYDRMMGARRLLADGGYPDVPLGVTEVGTMAKPGDEEQSRAQANFVAETFLAVPAVPNPVFAVHYFKLHDRSRGTAAFGLLHGEDCEADRGIVAYYTVARLLAGAERGTTTSVGKLRIHRIDRGARGPLTGVCSTFQTAVDVIMKRHGETPVKAWDLMGRPIALDWRGDEAAFAVPSDFVLIEGDVTIDPGTQLSMRPWLNHRVRVIAETARATAAEAVLRVVRPGSAAPLAEQDVMLMPGTNLYDVDAGTERPGMRIPLRAELSWPDGRVEQAQTVEYNPAFHVTPEQADRLERPEGMETYTLGPDDYTVWVLNPNLEKDDFVPYAGAADASAELAWGWTEDDLVLWIEMRDDVFVPSHPRSPWLGDGPQVSVGNESGEGQVPFVEFELGLGEDGRPIAFALEGPHYNPRLKAERRGDRTLFRVLFPFAELGIAPAPGILVRASAILNENDGAGREGYLAWGGGIADEKNPERFKSLLLVAGGE
ncbi:MAG: hypothetical protein JW951_07360 [Lentisphaerae bacterium]|nr:hypothetical protein [Lentisphaerota bacterium]